MRKTIAGFMLRLARWLWPGIVSESEEYCQSAKNHVTALEVSMESAARLSAALDAEKAAAAAAITLMREECDRIKADYDIERERLEKMLEKARADCGILSSGLLSRDAELQSVLGKLARLGIQDVLKQV